MAYLSYRYPRHHLSPPTRTGTPWSPVGTDQDEPADRTENEGEIDVATIDLREQQGTITLF